MINRRVIVERIECVDFSVLQIRMQKQIVEGDVVLAREFHRTVIEPGTSVFEQFEAVNAHLRQMGWPDVEGESVARVSRIAAAVHTEEAIAAWSAWKVQHAFRAA